MDRTIEFRADLRDFGEAAVFDGGRLAVIFHPSGSISWTSQDEVVIEQPRAEALTSDLAALGQSLSAGPDGDTLTIAGQEYVALSVGPDRGGVSVITLQETD